MLLSQAIHALDMLTYVAGPPARVFCRTTTRVNPIEVEDCAAASLELRDGSLATITATLGSPEEVSRHRFHFAGFSAESGTEAYTSSGPPWTITPDTPEAATAIEHALAGWVERPEEWQGQFLRFADALDAGAAPPVTLADARASLELLTAMYWSARTGDDVPLPLDGSHPLYKAGFRDPLDLQRRSPQAPERASAGDAVGHRPDSRRAADHPWHHTLWFTIKFVNGENFWEEYGRVRRAAPRRPDHGALDPSRSRDGRHRRSPLDRRGRPRRRRTRTHIDWTITLEPRSTSSSTARRSPRGAGTEASPCGVAPDWTDTRLLLADGSSHDRVLGEPSRWCDLSGTVEGSTAGALLLDGPRNIRHPVPWYGSTRAATYGDEGWSNFLNASFLWAEPLAVAAGDALELSYRIVVHDGMWDVDRCASEWDRWTST